MTALPAQAAQAVVEAELPAVYSWAARHNWAILWRPDQLQLRAATYHNAVGRLVEATAGCDSFRALPPVWRFVRPGSDDTGKAYYPAPGPGSIFHGDGLICAPWSRLAYKEHGGPHDNWSSASSWLNVHDNVTKAHTLADMLAVIHTNICRSPGMMA